MILELSIILLSAVICRSYGPSLAYTAIALASVQIIRVIYAARQSSRRKRDAARELGASVIPQVKGRLPLNFDVLLAWLYHADEDVGRLFHDLAGRYGPTFNTRVLAEDQVLSIDPDVFDAVMKDQFRSFHKGPKFHHRAKGLLGEGIFNSDGQQWAKHRQTLRPFFRQDRFPSEAIKRLLLEALGSQTPGRAFDAQALFGGIALDIAILFITGSGPLRQDTWPNDKAVIAAALADGQRVMGRRLKVGSIWPIFELTGDGLEGPATALRRFFQPYIARALRRRRLATEDELDDKADSTEASLLDRLVASQHDERYITEQLINVLLAARDTTTSMLTFLTYAMITQKAAFDHLQSRAKTGVRVDDDKQAFILETLRLFPPVPLNIRRAARHTVLPGNLHIPAGVSIVLSTIHMQRSRLYWGEDADDFRPDRMLDVDRVHSPFKTFNVGPRACPGRNLALSVANIWLDTVIEHLETESVSLKLDKLAQPVSSRVPDWWSTAHGSGRGRGGREEVWPVSDIILTVKGGLWIRIDRESGGSPE